MRAGKPGVVDYKDILVIEIIHDVPEMLVLDLAGVAVDHHHARIFTFLAGVWAIRLGAGRNGIVTAS